MNLFSTEFDVLWSYLILLVIIKHSWFHKNKLMGPKWASALFDSIRKTVFYLKSDCHLPKVCFYLHEYKLLLPPAGKCFLFHVKSSFCFWDISPSHTWLIILIRFITLKSNWMNPCEKTERTCNESVNNEFKIMRKKDSLHQIMRMSK